MTSTFSIGRFVIGPRRAFVIAEAGVNHDGEVAEAHRLIDAAAEAGADAVKFQTWKTELLCKPGTEKAAYQKENDGTSDDQFAMLKRLELPYEAHPELQRHAAEVGLEFLSTPDEIESARFLVSLGVKAIKIGSGELDNLAYLAQLAGFGLPLILSTGMGTLEEVDRAVRTIRARGNPALALLHTVSTYPAPADAMNLRAIATMREAFGVPTGLSDHYPGVEAVLAATGIGCAIWEKHLTRDTARHGPDHSSSLDPREFKRQVQALRTAEAALGDGIKRPHPVELPTRDVVRKRLAAAADIPSGTRLNATHLTALRATEGLSVADWERVENRITSRALVAGAPITDNDLA